MTRPGGVGYAVLAYGSWGLVPLFWPLIGPVHSVEVLAHRVVWSLVFAAFGWGALALWRRGIPDAVGLKSLRRPRTVLLLVLASIAISINWGVFIFAVQQGRMVETALGYYVNPILSIVLGVVVLSERLRRLQWVAVGIAALAVVVLTTTYGRVPWISLTLAVSFGCYGLLKKRIRLGALTSLLVESAVLTPVALGFLVVLAQWQPPAFDPVGDPRTSILLVLAGLVTLLPLIWFSAAAARVPLSLLGMLQYITPTMQFLVGVLILAEPMPPGRWIGFALVWLSLVILSADGLRRWKGNRRPPERVPPEGLAARR
ncbi:EamA family transporter RarD [Microlunatus sp. Y2014]|uniref:EamA family transporter RarD n=1 Tax=Microlunatus sp. Y2014 TaxID=3418488 RepID=UPI003DA70DE0